jgi:phage shock protein A
MMTSRIARLWRAVIGSGLSELETQHAEELLDLEREDLHRKVSKYNQALAGYAALSERLRAQIERLTREQTDLAPRLRARLEAGDRAAAGKHALRSERIEQELLQLREQREQTEQTYRELVRARDAALVAARDKMEELKRSIGEFRVQEALAELNELAAGMNGTLGVDNATLERLKERIDEKRHMARGRARVAREAIDTSSAQEQEVEQTMLAEAALRRYEHKPDTP